MGVRSCSLPRPLSQRPGDPLPPGRDSPHGFWRDSFNYERLRADVLTPFGPGGSRVYRSAAHDLATDAVLSPGPQTAPASAVLLVDGLFLHRDELSGTWDFSVFLEVPFTETARRMSTRDGTAADPSLRRYVQAQRLYHAACSPRSRATMIIDNTDVNDPIPYARTSPQP